MYGSVSCTLQIFQTAAVLEILHAAFGLTRSNVQVLVVLYIVSNYYTDIYAIYSVPFQVMDLNLICFILDQFERNENLVLILMILKCSFSLPLNKKIYLGYVPASVFQGVRDLGHTPPTSYHQVTYLPILCPKSINLFKIISYCI